MQLDVWAKEYADTQGVIPTTHRRQPSSALPIFEKYLADNHLRLAGPIVDLGCGNGRNALYFAKKGYEVIAIDFVDSALAIARSKKRNGLDLRFIHHSLPDRLPLPNSSIGLILDIATTPSLNTTELKKTKAEIVRVLRPGGFFVTFVPARHNALYEKLPKKQGGKFVLLQNGVWDRVWDVAEIASYYATLHPQMVYLMQKDDVVAGRRVQLDTILGIFVK